MQGTVARAPADPDGDVLAWFRPVNGPDLAVESGAWRGWRKDQSPDPLLRTLLIHAGGRALVAGDRGASASGRLVGRSPFQATAEVVRRALGVV